MNNLVDKLRCEHLLTSDEYHRLLSGYDAHTLKYIAMQAREVAQSCFGNRIYIRGLIEVGNYCRNNCLYCGIRRGNMHVYRYRLTHTEIMACCEKGYNLGFRTFVLQGGEDILFTCDEIEHVVTDIHLHFPDCAITLSLGERSREEYERFFCAGASRYLLRHETYNPVHYRSLHPADMSLENRLRCLKDLKEIGYQTGTGIMVGSPGQTMKDLVQDLCFIQEFCPQMIGIGPFIPHYETPFADACAGSLGLTLLLLSIFRLMHPYALIPSTTALATLCHDGREQGILAGANVVMPNLSPPEHRANYELYNHKAFSGAEAAEGLELLQKQMQSIGYVVSKDRGDYKTIV